MKSFRSDMKSQTKNINKLKQKHDKNIKTAQAEINEKIRDHNDKFQNYVKVKVSNLEKKEKNAKTSQIELDEKIRSHSVTINLKLTQ
jgi:hypothetical protein